MVQILDEMQANILSQLDVRNALTNRMLQTNHFTEFMLVSKKLAGIVTVSTMLGLWLRLL
jgi:hypothetical protein